MSTLYQVISSKPLYMSLTKQHYLIPIKLRHNMCPNTLHSIVDYTTPVLKQSTCQEPICIEYLIDKGVVSF